MKLDALIAFTQASYRSMKLYRTIEHFSIQVASLSIFFIQLHVVCLTFEILFTTILHFFQHLRHTCLFFKSVVQCFCSRNS